MTARALTIACLTILLPSAVGGQRAGSDGLRTGSAGAWLDAWSALYPIADIEASEVRGARIRSLVEVPAPRVGTLWTAGNPAALPDEIRDARSDFRLRYESVSGDYRRPLDVDERGTLVVSGFGWRPVGERGSAIGRVTATREELSGGTWAPGIAPYTLSPLVPTDTTGPDMARSGATLEGAIGWNVAGFGFGASIGYDVQERTSRRSKIARTVRATMPAIVVGVTRAVPSLGTTFGIHVRRLDRNETIFTSPNPFGFRVYQLEGLAEVEPLDFASQPYYRRIERQGRAVGASASGSVWGATWALFGETTRLDERQYSQRRRNPDSDTWKADGVTLGASVQRRLLGSRVLVTGFAGYASAEGEATRSDLTGFIHAANGSALALGAEARADLGPGWRAAASAAFQRTSRIVNDPLAELQLDQQLFRPAYTAEIARRIGPRTELAVGYAMTPAFANSAIPDGAGLGPVFQRLVAPGLEYSSGPALAHGVQVALLREVRSGSKLVVRGRYDRVSPDAGAAAAFRPAGERTGVQVEVAVITTRGVAVP
jgi:hypothetical protein